jgi:hypothetical protein
MCLYPDCFFHDRAALPSLVSYDPIEGHVTPAQAVHVHMHVLPIECATYYPECCRCRSDGQELVVLHQALPMLII